MRVLLVEDSVDVAQAIQVHLERLGHTVDWESNGTDALAMVVADHYDLIVLDVMLPGTDGYTLLERVRALDLGADDYLIKPFDFRHAG